MKKLFLLGKNFLLFFLFCSIAGAAFAQPTPSGVFYSRYTKATQIQMFWEKAAPGDAEVVSYELFINDISQGVKNAETDKQLYDMLVSDLAPNKKYSAKLLVLDADGKSATKTGEGITKAAPIFEPDYLPFDPATDTVFASRSGADCQLDYLLLNDWEAIGSNPPYVEYLDENSENYHKEFFVNTFLNPEVTGVWQDITIGYENAMTFESVKIFFMDWGLAAKPDEMNITYRDNGDGTWKTIPGSSKIAADLNIWNWSTIAFESAVTSDSLKINFINNDTKGASISKIKFYGSTGIDDSEAPSKPGGLSTNLLKAESLVLAWTPSTDNLAVVSYIVSQDGVELSPVSTNSIGIEGLTSETAYQFTVKAMDAAGNVSPVSEILSVTTPQPVLGDPIVGSLLLPRYSRTDAIQVFWNAATPNPGAIVEYEVFVDDVSKGTKPYVEGKEWFDKLVTGLEAGKSYNFKVVVTDANGLSSSNSIYLETKKAPLTEANLMPFNRDTDTLFASYAIPECIPEMILVNDFEPVGSNPPFVEYLDEDGANPHKEFFSNAWGLPDPGVTGSWQDITIGYSSVFQIDSAKVFFLDYGLADVPDQLNFTYLDKEDNTWKTVPGSAKVSTDLGKFKWNIIEFSNPVTTDSIRMNFINETAKGMTISKMKFFGQQSGETDTEAPSVPTNLVASQVEANSLVLSWDASTDNVGVTEYIVSQDDVELTPVGTNSLSITGLTESTQYSFTVKAKDAAGNISAASEVLEVTTLLVGISDARISSVSVFPNPMTDKLCIELKGVVHAEISIYSLTGRLVYNKNVIGSQIVGRDELRSAGTYLLKIETSDNQVWNKQIIVK
jgi:chitodextrinase